MPCKQDLIYSKFVYDASILTVETRFGISAPVSFATKQNILSRRDRSIIRCDRDQFAFSRSFSSNARPLLFSSPEQSHQLRRLGLRFLSPRLLCYHRDPGPDRWSSPVAAEPPMTPATANASLTLRRTVTVESLSLLPSPRCLPIVYHLLVVPVFLGSDAGAGSIPSQELYLY